MHVKDRVNLLVFGTLVNIDVWLLKSMIFKYLMLINHNDKHHHNINVIICHLRLNVS
jgi:hypothetical protein